MKIISTCQSNNNHNNI